MSTKNLPLKIMAFVIGSVFLTAALVFVGIQLKERQWGAVPATLDFPPIQKVSEESRLFMAFPEKMDKASVAKNLEMPADFKGNSYWKDNVLVFEPEKKLEQGATYSFHVNRQALTAGGKPVNKSLEYKFTVSGPPVLSGHYPLSDVTEIPVDSKITLVFDRPLIPLSAVQGRGTKKYQGDWPVTITPAIAGTWKWLGTSTVEFDPDGKLTSATNYKVSIPAGIVDLIGDKTKNDFSWSFTTTRPQIMETNPGDGYDKVGPSPELSVTFNLPIGLNSANASVQLMKGTYIHPEAAVIVPPPEMVPAFIAYGEEEADGKKRVAENRLKITPKNPLELGTPYYVILKAGLKGKEGDLGLEADYILSFSTVGEFKVEKAEYKEGRIAVKFSSPINNEKLKGNIAIEPKAQGWDELRFETDSWTDFRELYLYPSLKPSTEYKLTIGNAVEDQFGRRIPEPQFFTFKTDSLSPDVTVLSKGVFGIFETARPPLYPMQATNVSELNIEFARVPFSEFLKIRKMKIDNWESQPDLSGYMNYKKITLPLKNALNVTEVLNFDIERETGVKLAPGIYALKTQAPQYRKTWGDKEPVVDYQFFALTDIALTLKYSGNRALIWAMDMEKGIPVEGVAIKFHSISGNSPVSGKTDKDGFFETELDLSQFQTSQKEWLPEFWVTGTKGNNFSFVSSQWNEGLDAWNFGISEDFKSPSVPPMRLDSYVYTERQAYRPGDTVHYKALLRLRDKNGLFHLPKESQKVMVMVNDSQGNEIYNKILSPNAYGSLNGDFPVDAKAALGQYNLSLRLMPEDSVDYNWGGTGFYVLAYRKPEYKVEVAPEKEDYFGGDTLRFKVKGNYFFGAPMDGAKVNWRATSTDYYFNKYADGWYSFALDENWCWWDCQYKTENVTEGEGKLDTNGNHDLSFEVKLDDKSVSQVVNLEADVTDVNNQVVSARASVPVHKAGVYVGVRLQDYAVAPKQKAKVDIVAVDPAGLVIKGQKVKVSLFSRVWNTVKKKGVDGQYYFDNEPKDTFINDTKVSTNEKGKAIAELYIEKGGSYRVVAEAEDGNGRVSKAGASVYAFSDTYINWPHTNNDKIDVIADKPEYKIGDTAKILVKSPYQGEGVKALVTVERENVMTKKIIEVKSNAQPVEIPITADLAPNAYISVIVIKPRVGQTFDENGKDTGAPSFKIGYAKLKVETAKKELSLSITTDKPKYGPGEKVALSLLAKNSDGKPVEAELSVGVVDMSVQTLLGFELPNLVRRFYEERGLGVRTAEMLKYLIETFKPGTKGGGGGDAESRLRTNFKDTAYWNPAVTTDKGGKAEISFILPDNLTTWQVLAIAHTKDHLFGARAETFIETKKVIVRPIRPRFAVVGDEIALGATVHNFTETDQTFKVTLSGAGFVLKNGGEKTVTVKPDKQEKLLFPLTITPTEKAVFHFKAEGNGVADEIEESIPVYVFGTPQSVATTGVTDKETVEQVYIPGIDEAKDGKLTVTVSPTLATFLPKGLDYLVRFPYGCAEQTVSSFLPNVAVAALQGFDAFRVVDDKTLEKNITGGLEKLYTFQRGDGGFGYWERSNESYPYLTAYIVYALEMTKKSGYAVDAKAIARAKDYLTSVLRSQDLTNKIDLATRAYILYVISSNSQADTSLLNNLYEKRKDLPLFAKAYLAMAYNQSGGKAKTLMDEMMANIKIDARGTHFEEKNEGYWSFAMNTNTRTTALVLQALLHITPNNEQIPKIVRYLLDTRELGHWDTTQSTVASLFALVNYLKMTKELDANYTVTVGLDGVAALTEKFGKDNILTKKELVKPFEELTQEKMNNVAIGMEGTGRLYFDMLLDYFLIQDVIAPTDQGMGIQRTMAPFDSKQQGVKVNGTYKIKLAITVPDGHRFVAIESPLPAGFEAVDFTLQTSQQDYAGGINKNYWENGLYYFNHTEFRDDRVFLFADFLPAGVYEYEYLARATTPGKFRYRPARAFMMYYPETFGQTEGGWLEIKE